MLLYTEKSGKQNKGSSFEWSENETDRHCKGTRYRWQNVGTEKNYFNTLSHFTLFKSQRFLSTEMHYTVEIKFQMFYCNVFFQSDIYRPKLHYIVAPGF